MGILFGVFLSSFVVGRSSSSSRIRISTSLSRRGKELRSSSKDVKKQVGEGSKAPMAVTCSVSENANGNIDKDGEEEEEDCVNVGHGELEGCKGASPRGQGIKEFKFGRAAQTINLFRDGEIQVF